ncbi:MAG: glycoside hydrolase family 5 protein [Ruminococcus sp.]|nr:glycoside hydrolase family 5 protein [Ruminococcus sp.]
MALSVAALSSCGGRNDSSGGTDSKGSANSSAVEESETDEPKDYIGDFNDLDQDAVTLQMGMGWNLGNQLEASSGGTPNETAWGNPTVTQEMLDMVKENGFSTVRIPVSYLNKIGEGPDYTIDSEWLDRVQEVVDYVVSNDMFAVVNMHGDGYYTVAGGWLLCAEEDQTEIKDKYGKVWTQIAERFKDYDEHLIFESMNEEFNNDYGQPDPVAYENINAYNQIFVDSVRGTGSNNAKRWLLMPGWNTNIMYTVGDYGFKIPEDKLCEADGNRLMISVHYYDPYNFTLDENATSHKSQWGQYSEKRRNDNWGQEDHVDEQMKQLNEKFVSKGYPVVVGEMGVIDWSSSFEDNNEFRRYWLEYIINAERENKIIPIYWDNGWNGDKGFGIFNRKTLEVSQPELIEAMMRAINAEESYEIAAPKGYEK